MKGTFFQKPLELKLNVDGESWHQGDAIAGTLAVKNHGAAEASLEGMRVVLGYADTSKVHQRKPGAFEIIAEVALGDSSRKIAPQQEESFPWRFQTDRNCPITEKSASLYLIYGSGQALEQLGQLQLQIAPFRVIGDFLSVLTTEFRFVVKSQKSTARRLVEVKLSPPSAAAYAAVDSLMASFRIGDEEKLEVRYAILAKKVEASAASTDLKKKKLEFEQEHAKSDYLLASGRLNHAHFEDAIRQVLGSLGLSTFT